VGSTAVVMIDEDLDRVRKMSRVQDQQPVQTFGPNGPDEPFRDAVCLRSLKRRPNNTHLLGFKDGVEAARELAIAVANQQSNRLRPFNERPGDLPRLLRAPFTVRMRRAAGSVDAAAADFNEEQHIQSLEPYRVDGEEIHRDHALGLGTETLAMTVPHEPMGQAGRRDGSS
jgi:hypothetical protein